MSDRTFEAFLAVRNAADYADFLFPYLTAHSRVLDMGCGTGTITVGLAERAAEVVGVDPEKEFDDARRYASEHGLENVEFRCGSVYALDLPDDHYDACLAHSMLETLERPLDGLTEIKRVLRPGGIVGVACVEYGGLILAGPGEEILRRFYSVRERLWQLENTADPYRGRRLRGLLECAGFEDVDATSKFFSYGTPAAVAEFGLARAEQCGADDWYAERAQEHRLASAEELEEMRRAWVEWSKSSEAYLAFAWCRAVGRKPSAV
jgi:ubiquinone/menaquinone biosynthesis C-methylase UbiE